KPPQGAWHQQSYDLGPRGSVRFFQNWGIDEIEEVQQAHPRDAGDEMDPAQHKLQQWREMFRRGDTWCMPQYESRQIHYASLADIGTRSRYFSGPITDWSCAKRLALHPAILSRPTSLCHKIERGSRGQLVHFEGNMPGRFWHSGCNDRRPDSGTWNGAPATWTQPSGLQGRVAGAARASKTACVARLATRPSPPVTLADYQRPRAKA